MSYQGVQGRVYHGLKALTPALTDWKRAALEFYCRERVCAYLCPVRHSPTSDLFFRGEPEPIEKSVQTASTGAPMHPTRHSALSEPAKAFLVTEEVLSHCGGHRRQEGTAERFRGEDKNEGEGGVLRASRGASTSTERPGDHDHARDIHHYPRVSNAFSCPLRVASTRDS